MKRSIFDIPVEYTGLTLQDKLIKAQSEKIKCINRLKQLHSMNDLDMFQIHDVQVLLERINLTIDVIELQMA